MRECQPCLTRGSTTALPPTPATSPGAGRRARRAGSSLLFLREEEIRLAQDLLFFAYRDFTNAADVILEELGLGRAHHRALHFIGRNPRHRPSPTCWASCASPSRASHGCCRVLVEQGYVAQAPGRDDRRQRLLTLTPKAARRWSAGCSSASASACPPPTARPAGRRWRASAA